MRSSLRSRIDPEKLPADLVNDGAQLASLPPKTVEKLAKQILKSNPDNYDTYMLFTKNAKQAVFQFVSRCPQQLAKQYSQAHHTVIDMIHATRNDRYISDTTATVACYAYFALLDPNEVNRIFQQEGVEGNFNKFIHIASSRGLSSTNVAVMRRWRPILRDEIQAILNSGRESSEQQAKEEYLIQRLIAKFHIDRQDATAALRQNNGDMEKAAIACGEYAKAARQRLAPQEPPTLPTRDTRCPPDVTPRTRAIAILGTDDHDDTSRIASPSLGDGWIVSDFYLWLHVLDGMGRNQEWITSMPPRYLAEKYGQEDEVTDEAVDENFPPKPVQTKWASGFIHGDPFEERVVVLDENALPLVERRVTIGPNGLALRDFFLQRLEQTVSLAAASGDPVLILMFAHGDYDSNGGLFIGVDPYSFGLDMDKLLKPSDVSKILSRYPQVKVTIYMTSCFSGHWVETTEFQGNNKPTVLAAAQPDQESFAFVWSLFQRHAGGLFFSGDPHRIAQGTVCAAP